MSVPEKYYVTFIFVLRWAQDVFVAEFCPIRDVGSRILFSAMHLSSHSSGAFCVKLGFACFLCSMEERPLTIISSEA
jgi:hypothetical protein